MYYCVSAAANLFDVIITFMFFDDLLSWKDIKTYKKFLLGFFMFAATIANNAFIHNKVLTITISTLILLAASSGFKGKLNKKILVVIGYMLLVIIADILFTLIAIQFFSSDVNNLLNTQSDARMIGKIISKPIFLLLVRIVSIFVKKENFKVYRNCGIALLTIPIINIALIISMIQFFDYININNITPVYFASLCILYNTILVFFLFERIMGMALLKNKYDILENQIVIQEEQVKGNETEHNRIKAIKHDLKIHFQTLYVMLTNGLYDKAKSYLETTRLVEDIEFCDVHTGNIALDAILNSKLNEAEQKGISTEVYCRVPSDMEISDIDISVLFGNLLDNAIEACQRADCDEKEITVNIKYNKNRLSCYIENTAQSVKKEGNRFVSLKKEKDEHGIGLYNIESVILKYDGICKMVHEQGYFKTYMTLFV